MSKVGGKSGGKGGAKKTKSKGNGSDQRVTTRKLTTSQEILFKLRGVLFEATGKDRTDFGIPEVLMCKKLGETSVRLTLSGAVPRDDKIPIFAMIKNSMEEQYEDSGFGWDDADKKKELGEKGGRFLIARDEKDGKVLGFVSFRFTRAGEAVYQPIGPACVHMLDFVVSQRFRKNGLGKYMMAITMMIAKKADLPCVTIPVFSEEWKAFLDKTVKGEEWTQAHDDELGGGGSVRVEMASDDYGFDLYVKMIGRPNLTAPAPTAAPKAVAAPTPPAPPVTPAKKIEVVTSDSPTGVVDVPPAAPTENKLGTFDMSSFSNSLDEAQAQADIEVSTDAADSEEDQVLESLIVEFEKRNGREPTEEEMEMWRTTLREAAEEAMQGATPKLANVETPEIAAE